MEHKLGLALGGGGARGLAHIGVLKVFEDEGIPIACLAGASIGGLIAATYATGKPARQLEAEALHICRLPEMARFLDFSINPHALLDVGDITGYLAGLVGAQTQFEDLRIPLALAAVDLVTACPVALTSGPLLPAVLASTAVPGLFPAVHSGSRRLVDGGLLNNLPVDLARQLGAQVVAAVDVQFDPFHELPWQDQPEPERSLLPMPPFLHDVYRSGVIMIAELTRRQLSAAPPEIYLRPCLPLNLGVFTGFPRASECIAAGEQAARQAVPHIRAALKPAD